MLFDARAAKTLAPGARLLVPDCPGLRLEGTQSSKTWTYRYRNQQGSLKQAKLGTWPAMSLLSAMQAWNELRNQRDAGADPVAQKRAARLASKVAAAGGPASTVQELVAHFLDHYIDVERQKESAGSARSALERLLAEEPDFAELAPNKVGRGVAFNILDKRRAHPTATAKLRALLGQAWDHGLDAGIIDPDTANHWRNVLHGRLKSRGKIIGGEHQGKVYRVLSDKELSLLLPWCMEHMNPNGRDGTILYLWTGLRGIELFGLRPEYISQERDGWWITYPVALLKTAEHADTVDHRVPLVGRALEVVQQRLERVGPTGYLFENMPRGTPQQYTREAFSSYVYHLQPYSAKVKRRESEGLVAPVAGWSPHDLRRTARTMLSKLRCELRVAEAFIGHKPPGIVGVYDRHTFDAEKREIAPELARAMEAFIKPACRRGRSPS